MEIAINDESIGFLNFNLRPDVVPKTVKNFVGKVPLARVVLSVVGYCLAAMYLDHVLSCSVWR